MTLPAARVLSQAPVRNNLRLLPHLALEASAPVGGGDWTKPRPQRPLNSWIDKHNPPIAVRPALGDVPVSINEMLMRRCPIMSGAFAPCLSTSAKNCPSTWPALHTANTASCDQLILARASNSRQPLGTRSRRAYRGTCWLDMAAWGGPSQRVTAEFPNATNSLPRIYLCEGTRILLRAWTASLPLRLAS